MRGGGSGDFGYVPRKLKFKNADRAQNWGYSLFRLHLIKLIILIVRTINDNLS